MNSALRRVLDGSEPSPGFALFTFTEPHEPFILVSVQLAAAFDDATPRALGAAFRWHLERYGKSYERRVGKGARFTFNIDKLTIGVFWHGVTTRADEEALILCVFLPDEQLNAERALLKMERHIDLANFIFLGVR